jgi:hypothetical protein
MVDAIAFPAADAKLNFTTKHAAHVPPIAIPVVASAQVL